jgi:hypothetical protein
MVGSWCPSDIDTGDDSDETFARSAGEACVYAGITLAVKPRGYDIIEGADFIKGRCDITRLRRNTSDSYEALAQCTAKEGTLTWTEDAVFELSDQHLIIKHVKHTS